MAMPEVQAWPQATNGYEFATNNFHYELSVDIWAKQAD